MFLVQHKWRVFLGGFVLVALILAWLFYHYLVEIVNKEPETRVIRQEINQEFYKEALNALEKKASPLPALPLRNPFKPTQD